MLLQASNLDLPHRSSPSSLKPTSLLFEPTSQSLALMLSDSSFLLYPSLSPSFPPTPIPPISTSASFLLLKPNPNILFISASPSSSSSSILLRAWIRRPSSNLFAPALLSYKKGSARTNGLVLDLRHGFNVKVAGAVNVLVIHSVAESQIWVLAARMVGEGGVDLVKCAVIGCVLPIYSIRVTVGFLMLGEVDGVRIFPLRPLVKGGMVGKRRGFAVDSLKKRDLNEVVVPVDCCSGKHGGLKGGKVDGCRAQCKLRTLKLRQNAGEFCSFFVMMRCAVVHDSVSDTGALPSVKAVSIHLLSQKKFLILDSVGDLYLLSLQNTTMASEASAHSSITSKCARINRLDVTMKVQMLAVLPDMSARRQVVWLSDGAHSVHVMSVADMESPVTENDKDENEEKAMQFSAIQVIFTSEKVEDIVPLSANAILILGQGNIFAYSIA